MTRVKRIWGMSLSWVGVVGTMLGVLTAAATAVAQHPGVAAPTTLLVQKTDFDPSDLGLDGDRPPAAETPAAADAGVNDPSVNKAAAATPPSTGDLSRMSPTGSSDENSEIAPEEIISIPEMDNTELLQRLVEGEEVIERYDDKSMRARVQVKPENGKPVRHGAYVEFYRGGGKFCEGVYDKGKREGAWKYWFPDGSLAKVGQYQADRAIGTWYYLRQDKSLERTEDYEAGVQSGRWLSFGPDGKTILAIRRFSAGRPQGKWHAWYSPTRKRFEYEFADGVQDGTARAWYPDGKKWFEGTYADGRRDGVWVWWDRGGRELKRNEWKNGQRVSAE